MNRREWILKMSIASSTFFFSKLAFASKHLIVNENRQLKLKASQFGPDFIFGTATSAFQIEGATNEGNKTESIWDVFSHQKNKIKDHSTAEVAADFYHNFQSDLEIAKKLGTKAFRFSIAWTRIILSEDGSINDAGVRYYQQIIDYCLSLELEPWVMLYHWDLPQWLELKGGWTNRIVIEKFSHFVNVCTTNFGDKVKNWMILNEPLGFTGFGYMTGIHAPGRKGLHTFLAAVHHTAMCQAEGGRIVRQNVKYARIGTTFSCSPVDPYTNSEKDIKAAKKLDALLNRLFIEPSLGFGYPITDLPFLSKMKKYIQEGDLEKLAFDFDFIGLQNYFRIVAQHSFLMPFIHAKEVSPAIRKVPVNQIGCEINADAMYRIIMQFSLYSGVKMIIITENGICLDDKIELASIHDTERISYMENYLENILKAKNEGACLGGYFAWSLLDNFEWSEGFTPRFGLVYVDFKTQKRTLKDSAYWYKEFLSH